MWTVTNEVLDGTISSNDLEIAFQLVAEKIIKQPFLAESIWTLIGYVKDDIEKQCLTVRGHNLIIIGGPIFYWGWSADYTSVSGYVHLIDRECKLTLIFIKKV